MVRQKMTLSIDEDLYYALKKLPREVSVSEVINLILRLALEEVKLGREMSDKELYEWFRKDPKRLKVQDYMREKMGPYFDTIDEVLSSFKRKKKDKK